MLNFKFKYFVIIHKPLEHIFKVQNEQARAKIIINLLLNHKL